MKIKTNLKSVLLLAMLFSASIMSFAQPANDLPCNAIFLPVDGITYYYDNLLATDDAGEVVPPAGTSGAGTCVSRDGWCGGDLVADATVWFTFQAPASGKVIISTCDALTVIDAQIAVYSAGLCSDYNTFTLRGANDDDPAGCSSGSGYESVLYLEGLTPGSLYYLQVDGFQGDDGLFGVSITQGFESANNNICNAQSITVGATTTCGNNAFDTAEQGEPAGNNWFGDPAQNSVWFKFTAPASGKVYLSTDYPNSFDTQLGVYASSDNTCSGTLTEVNSNDDGGTLYFVTSELELTCLRPGNTYFVQLDGYSSSFGDFCLLVNDTATTTGLSASLSASASVVCGGEPFTVTSTANGGSPGLGGTYSGSNATVVNIPDNSLTGANSSIGLGGSFNVVTPTSVVSVSLNITHTYDGDIDAYLVGPGNCGTLELTTDNGGTDENYTNTVLSTAGVTSITAGTAPFTGVYLSEGTIAAPPVANNYTNIPATAINGCPIDGSWTLWVFDDLGGDVGTLDSWSLSITESYYTHTITGAGNIQTTVSGTNNSTATGTVTNAPAGFNSYITTVVDFTGCEQTDTVVVKVFDTPSIVSVSNGCSTGNDGSITITASAIDNGNFTVPADLGVVEYSFDGGNTWGTNNTATGLAAGTYNIGVRNSANPSCLTSGFTTIQGAPSLFVNNVNPVCEGTGVTVSGSAAGGSQFTYSGNAAPNLAIPDANTAGISSSVNILGAGTISAASIVSVTLNIPHEFVGDVDVYLVGPGNCGTLDLTTDNGGGGVNYTNTVLNTSAPTIITSGSAPFTGTFRPEGTITGVPNTDIYTTLPTTAINGCPVSGEWTLRVFDDAGGDVGTLNNWSISLTNNGNFTHALSGPGTIGTVTYGGANNSNGSFDVTGIPLGVNEYIYNVTTVSGCVKADTFDVKVFDIPSITNTVTTCSSGSNGTISVTASTIDNANFTGIDIGVVEYSYDNGSTWTTSNVATGLAQGAYDLYVRNSANINCQSGPLTVSLSGGFVANAGPDTTVCPGSQVTLIASGGTSYLWSTAETSATINVAPTQTTIYSVTISDNSGCSDIQTVTVSTFTPPVPALGPDVTICNGESATLTASGGGDYLWSTNETTASITVTPTGTTVYAVTVTDVNDCVATEDITVNVSPLVVAGLTSNSPVCESDVLVLTSTASGGTLAGQQTYSGSTTANLNIPDGSGIGVSSAINIAGASVINNASTVTVTLNINHTWAEDVDAYLVGPNGCGTLELTTDNGAGGDNYVNTVLTTASPDVIGSVGFNTPPFTGTFAPEGTITGTNTNIYGLPTNGIDGCPVDGNWTLSVFDDDAIIAGTLLDWSLSVTADNVYGHALSGTGTVSNTTYSGTQLETAQFSVTGVAPGIHEYINTVTDAFGCTGKDTVEVKVFAAPVFGSATGTCSDGSNGEITVTATLDNANFTGNDIGVIEYSFDGGNTWVTNNIQTGLAPGIYQVYLRNSANISCESGPVAVSVFEGAVLAANNSGPVCEGTDFTVTATASGGSPNLSFAGSTVSGQTIPDADINGLSSNLSINGTGTISGTSTVTVTLNITHTFDSDLDAYLVGPGNCGTIELFTIVGAAGDNFTNTVLSTSATNVIGTAGNDVAPFTGTYAPEGNLTGPPAIAPYALPGTPLDGCPVNGSWTLHVFDAVGGDIGVLQDWSLNITNPVGFTHVVTGPGTLSTVSYTGQDNENSSVTVSDAPVGSSDYTVTVTDARGCTSSITTTAKVYDTPNVTSITGGCTGVITVTADPIDNANFTGNDIGVWEYSYDGGNTWTTSNVATNLPSATYDVYVRNSASTSCQFGPQSVTVYQKPVVTLPDPNICIGGSATLDAGQFVSYAWSTGETTQTISATTTDDYIVVVTDANGCTATDTASVSAGTSLPVNIGDFQFCDGGSATLDAGNPGANYTWSTGETTQLITASSGGVYSVTVSDNSGCTGTDSGTITEYPLPTIGLVDQFICGGQVTIDAGNAGSDFLWSTSETTQSISVSSSGTYSVTVTDGNGCIAADTVDIIPATAVTVTLPAVVEICSGDFATLDAGNAGADYLWSTGETTQTIDVNTANTYSVTVSSAGGCTGTASSDVFVNALPLADAGQASPICGGGTVTLTASGGVSYQWSDGATTQSTIVGPAQNTTYYVTVTDGNGCSATDSVAVSVFGATVVTISNDTIVCSTADVTLTAGGGVNYLWNTGASTATITVNPVNTTTYVVTVTDANSCTATGSVTVNTNPLPNASAGSDVGICEGSVLTIYGSGGGAYEWSNGVTTASLTVSPTSTTIYTLTVTDNNGCSDVDVITVNVNPLPAVSLSFANTVFCGTDAAVTASVSPPFGTLSGNGVTGLEFDPATVAIGGHLITYTYTDANSCENSASVAVSVEECAGIEELVKALEAAQVYPNPFSNEINIKFTAAANDEISVRMVDVLGRVINDEKVEVRKGENLFTITTGNELASGMYYVHLVKANKMVSFKLSRFQ